MEAFYKFFNQQYLTIQRHSFQQHPNGNTMFHELDDIIRQKDNFMNYIKLEYSVSILFNIMAIIPISIFLKIYFLKISSCDLASLIFLIVLAILKLLEILPKGLILYQTMRVGSNTNDPIMSCRRLMYLTRSKIFYYNVIIGYLLLGTYSIFLLLFKRNLPCKAVPQLHKVTNLLIITFFIRLIISFSNYYLHFKVYSNEISYSTNDMLSDKGLSPDIVKHIEKCVLTEANIDIYAPITEEKEREICCICMTPFALSDMIKILPCNKKHIFHLKCIDKWFCHNKNCPSDRKEITLKLIQRLKIY